MVGYCPICGKPVYFGEKKRSLGRDYHPLCLKCQKCNRQLTPGQHAEVTGDWSLYGALQLVHTLSRHGLKEHRDKENEE
ncbi:cysteine-rich protein 2-like [Pseudochaenichthys georgianus]|uniref:cysteine-rich protein 2-like n=1 Tax=Pseudochaenichthys georgianus TaxID=52239 RepID=UPI00146E1926|nr:cysteine-rich protein 2-like [Pseudochaenichthys georgianus]